MKTDYGWHNGWNGTNSSGFSGLPGGFRFSSGYFFDAGTLRLLVEFLAQWHLRLVSTAVLQRRGCPTQPTTIDTTAFLFVASGMPSESTLKKGVSGDALRSLCSRVTLMYFKKLVSVL